MGLNKGSVYEQDVYFAELMVLLINKNERVKILNTELFFDYTVCIIFVHIH